MTKIKLIDEGTKGQVLTYLKTYGYIRVGSVASNKALSRGLEENLAELTKEGHIIKLERMKGFCMGFHGKKVKIPRFRMKYVYYPQKVVAWGE